VNHVINGLRAAHLTARVAWLAGTIGLLILVALPTVMPALGHQVFVVRGASMEPSIPLGSVVVVRAVDPTEVHVGDVLTFHMPHGTVVTHRVTAISADDGNLAFQTKGDASQSADTTLVPASAVVGGVEYSLPGVGYLIYVLGSTAGVLVALAILAALLLAGWSMDRLIRMIGPSPPVTAARQAP
jgi:signal peptidase I